MTQTDMIWRFTVHVLGGPSDDRESILETHLAGLMDELMKLEECNPEFHDPSVGGTLADGEVEIEFTVDARAEEAVALAKPIVRAAIHAAGGATPRWDDGSGTNPAHVIEYEPEGTELTYA